MDDRALLELYELVALDLARGIWNEGALVAAIRRLQKELGLLMVALIWESDRGLRCIAVPSIGPAGRELLGVGLTEAESPKMERAGESPEMWNGQGRVCAFELGFRKAGRLTVAFPVPSPVASDVDFIERLARLFARTLCSTAAVRNLQHGAMSDYLTGLLNRRVFDQHLDKAVAQSLRYGVDLSLLMMDLDRFKWVNDTLGHPAGDDYLRTFARILEGSLRAADIAARWGGDEFVVLLPATSLAHAEQVATRIRAEADRTVEHPWLGVSVGAASLRTTRGLHPIAEQAALIVAADEALRRAKHRRPATQPLLRARRELRAAGIA
jgi:diguanylate cyclase (GGDEF)-like protein